MNKKYLLLILIVVGAILVIMRREDAGPLTSSLPGELVAAEETKSQVPTAPSVVASPADVAAAQATPAEVTTIAARHFRELGQCLQIKNSAPEEAVSFADLQAAVRNELGDVMASDTDWKNVHVKLPNGEQRRLRLEVEGAGEELSVKTLKYYGVDKENLPVELPLTKEQTTNPSDSFIASLEQEGSVTLREEARRGVFTTGAELYYVERNGRLSEIEMSFRGHSFKCTDLTQTNSKCRCF
jgi:hypothetical protein